MLKISSVGLIYEIFRSYKFVYFLRGCHACAVGTKNKEHIIAPSSGCFIIFFSVVLASVDYAVYNAAVTRITIH